MRRLPRMLKLAPPADRVPGLVVGLPGLTVEPAPTATGPPTPLPPRMVPPVTATGLPPCEPFTSTVPAVTVVAPVYELLPDRVRVLAPALDSAPVPPTLPKMRLLTVVVSVFSPRRLTGPVRPTLLLPPSVTTALASVTGLAIVASGSAARVPPARVSVPVPRAPLLPAVRVAVKI